MQPRAYSGSGIHFFYVHLAAHISSECKFRIRLAASSPSVSLFLEKSIRNSFEN